MKRAAGLLPVLFVLVLLPMLFGCGGGSAATTSTNPPPVALVSISLSDASVTLGAGETYQLTATVTGTLNTAVTWSLSGCTGANCGTISSTGLYTAPSVLPAAASVTATATSQADPTKSGSCLVQLMPITVSIEPAGAWVAPGATLQFTGGALYDRKNAGVTWALAPSTCGALSNVTLSSVTYTAPATVPNPPTVTLTATSITDPSKTAQITITVSVTRALAVGDYAFVFNGWEIHYTPQGYYDAYRLAIAGHFHADSSGNITKGVEDRNSSSGVSQSVSFTGTYGTGADGRGDFTIVTAQGTTTYHMTVDTSGSKGEFIKYDGLPADAPICGSGYFELQDNAAFSLSALAGPYAMGLFGTLQEANRLAAVGRFDARATGTFSNGKMDMTIQSHAGHDPQVDLPTLALTGSFKAPSSSTGRGTAALTLSPAPLLVPASLTFAYYVVSNEKILLVQTDTRDWMTPVLSGEMRVQKEPFSTASFNGPSIFGMTGFLRGDFGEGVEPVAVGQVVSSGSGSVTGIIDGTIDHTQIQPAVNQAFTGSYSVDADGRSIMTMQFGSAGSGHDTVIAYFFAQNEAFLTKASGFAALCGRLKPQAVGPFTAASISGTFRTYSDAPTNEDAENDSGLTTFDGVGGITSTIDLTDWHWTNLYHFDFNGTYSVAPNGRITPTFSLPLEWPAVFWVVSPTELVGIGAIDPKAGTYVLLEYAK